MKKYWYEMIHRPFGMGCQPAGWVDVDLNFVNRNGFAFGKVAYGERLTEEQLKNYDMEPVHQEGMIEIGRVNQEVLNGNRVKLTEELFEQLVQEGRIEAETIGTWRYVDLEKVKAFAEENKKELKELYKKKILKENRGK